MYSTGHRSCVIILYTNGYDHRTRGRIIGVRMSTLIKVDQYQQILRLGLDGRSLRLLSESIEYVFRTYETKWKLNYLGHLS